MTFQVRCERCGEVCAVLSLPEVCPHDGGPLVAYTPPKLVLVRQETLL